MAFFAPHTVQALFAFNLGSVQDRFMPASNLLGDEWRQACEAPAGGAGRCVLAAGY
ncbi:hypothetical protein LQ564_20985 [Massilia sp. G4R7]|uniref:Uncharacterized protein n=1 Tax=Massilia phyllostachyos TaxID=2898585 RepID=A0ABS8QB70_9BURK|nr:hypothetical protein [Massilia phyllostachyos]MCD2518778.1 hypothetical protein [Massilia phyllostachyos]